MKLQKEIDICTLPSFFNQIRLFSLLKYFDAIESIFCSEASFQGKFTSNVDQIINNALLCLESIGMGWVEKVDWEIQQFIISHVKVLAVSYQYYMVLDFFKPVMPWLFSKFCEVLVNLIFSRPLSYLILFVVNKILSRSFS